MYAKLWPEQGAVFIPAGEPLAGEYESGKVYQFPDDSVLPANFTACDKKGVIPQPAPAEVIEFPVSEPSPDDLPPAA